MVDAFFLFTSTTSDCHEAQRSDRQPGEEHHLPVQHYRKPSACNLLAERGQPGKKLGQMTSSCNTEYCRSRQRKTLSKFLLLYEYIYKYVCFPTSHKGWLMFSELLGILLMFCIIYQQEQFSQFFVPKVRKTHCNCKTLLWVNHTFSDTFFCSLGCSHSSRHILPNKMGEESAPHLHLAQRYEYKQSVGRHWYCVGGNFYGLRPQCKRIVIGRREG